MPKSAQVRWDDLQFLLAVIDHGSVAAAARALDVNHATILRHIADFETRTGVRMFDKTTRGYQISPDRRTLVEAMRDAMHGLGNVARLIDAARPAEGTSLRLTTTDTLAQYILPLVLPALKDTLDRPLEIMVDNAHVDFARMQAQLTVRPAMQLPPDLDGLPAGHIRFGVYGISNANALPWLGLTGPLARTAAADWIRRKTPGPAAHADSFLALAAMAAAGMGRTVLPSYVGAAHPSLSCLAQPKALPAVPIWVCTHVDYGRARHILTARKRLAEALSQRPEIT